MSSLEIKERFTIDAPTGEVWRFLIDPARVVVCLPGAHLDSTDGDGAYHGAGKVRVGGVTVQYKGRMTFEEPDPERRVVGRVGEGKEKAGGA